ncbi:MAG: 50S ribosomal protein L18 [Dehalococcoidia bacterium]|jgi:large subunit ribosomal protein L18|nr:MAG: 50S ribosomal protein L18 [Dehalococcoidia bacterium]
MTRVNYRQARLKRHQRVRLNVSGTTERPRLCVFRSLNHIYVQIIDDSRGHTLAAASSLDAEVKEQSKQTTKVVEAELVGALVGKRAGEAGVKEVVFDRGGYQYHGRIKALAEAVRKTGLKF